MYLKFWWNKAFLGWTGRLFLQKFYDWGGAKENYIRLSPHLFFPPLIILTTNVQKKKVPLIFFGLGRAEFF